MRRTVRVRHGSALGVSTPSAASWLDRASEPCNHRADRTPVGVQSAELRGPRRPGLFSLQSLPCVGTGSSRGSRASRRGRWLPCRSSRPSSGAARQVVSPAVSPTRPTFGRRASPDPPRARGSLSAAPRGSASRSPWTSHTGLTESRSFRRLRSVLPHRESVHVARCLSSDRPPRAGRRSPGRSRPSRALLPPGPRALDLHPSRRRRPSFRSTRVSRDTSRDAGTSTRAPLVAHATIAVAGNPRRQVESNVDDRNVPFDPSAVTRPVRPGPCRPSSLRRKDSSSDSHDLGRCKRTCNSSRGRVPL